MYFTFFLKWITLHVKNFNTTAQANKKQFQRSHIKQNKKFTDYFWCELKLGRTENLTQSPDNVVVLHRARKL